MDKPSVIRALGLIASLLAYFGINVPESTIELVAFVIVGIMGLYTAYKNNYLFERGLKQKETLEKEGLYEKNK